MSFFHVNRKLLPIKFHYGLFSGGTGTVQPTMPVYAKVLGFSSFVVGTIYTILPILGLIIKPAFGALADKFKWHRGVLLAWEVIVVSTYLGIWFIPPAHPNTGFGNETSTFTSEICYMGKDPPYLQASIENCLWTCDLTPKLCQEWGLESLCTTYENHNASLSEEEICIPAAVSAFSNVQTAYEYGCKKGSCVVRKWSREDSVGDTYTQWQFWLFVVLLVGAWGGTSVVTTISDTICIEICGDPHLYGKQRLWGSLGWGFFSIINGILIDAVSPEEGDKNYAPAFYLMLAPLIIDIVLSYYIKIEIPEQSESIGKDVLKVVMNLKNLVFMLWCAMVGVSFALVWNFLYWLLEDLAAEQSVMGQIKTIEGLVAGIECVIGETPAFFFGGWIVNKIGHGHAMSLVFTAIGLRYILYSVLVNPWWCLPIEILQNNYGLFYSTMTSYAKKVAPAGTEATIQSLMCAICEGVGVAIGSFIGGVMYDNYGGSMTFRYYGFFFFALVVINEIIEFLYDWEAKTKKLRGIWSSN